jgi:hypothetical protein
VLSYILSALSAARHAVALTLVVGAAATTMVAGVADQSDVQSQHQTEPVTASVALAPAITSEQEPTAKFDAALTITSKSALPETSPRPEARTNDIEALVKDCLAKYAAAKNSTTAGTAASEACRRAIEASGLPSTEFWTRFAPKAQSSATPQKPSMDPVSIEALAKYCITKYAAAKESPAAATTASEVCRRAIEASGLSATEFWAKFGKPQAPTSEPKTSTAPAATGLTQLVRYCLTMHAALTTTSSHEQVERASTVCKGAMAESKLTPSEFWTKVSASR